MAASLKITTREKTPRQLKPPTDAQKKEFRRVLHQLSKDLKQMNLQISKIYRKAEESSFWIIG